jgi:hypothetical protein
MSELFATEKTGVGWCGKANLAAISCLNRQFDVPKYPHRLLDFVSSSGAITFPGRAVGSTVIRFSTTISS